MTDRLQSLEKTKIQRPLTPAFSRGEREHDAVISAKPVPDLPVPRQTGICYRGAEIQRRTCSGSISCCSYQVMPAGAGVAAS